MKIQTFNSDLFWCTELAIWALWLMQKKKKKNCSQSYFVREKETNRKKISNHYQLHCVEVAPNYFKPQWTTSIQSPFPQLLEIQ